MVPASILFIIIFVIFMMISFSQTQIFYINKSFGLLILTSTLVSLMSYITTRKEDKLRILFFSFILFYYTILLFIISKTYKRLNNYLIQKKWLNKEFENKDFTNVFWASDFEPDDYDKELASKPSWLDKLLSFTLFGLPLLSTGWVFYFMGIE